MRCKVVFDWPFDRPLNLTSFSFKLDLSNFFLLSLLLVTIFFLSSSAPTVAFNLSSEDFSFRFFAEHSMYFALIFSN